MSTALGTEHGHLSSIISLLVGINETLNTIVSEKKGVTLENHNKRCVNKVILVTEGGEREGKTTPQPLFTVVG